jgi:hypothetical protein
MKRSRQEQGHGRCRPQARQNPYQGADQASQETVEQVDGLNGHAEPKDQFMK